MLIDKIFEEILTFLAYIITFLSMIAIVIELNDGLLIYEEIFFRSASIFFDPNYFGVISAIGVIILFSQKGLHNKFFFFINILALYFSGSRSAMLGLIFVIVLYLLVLSGSKISKRTKVIGTTVLSIFILIFSISGFFRFEYGLSGRTGLWVKAIKYIKSSPLYGHGEGSLPRLLESEKISHTSFHNYFLDNAVMYGVPIIIVIISIFLIILIKGFIHNVSPVILQVILLLFFNMFFITISLGGLGAISLIFSIFLGICNYRSNIFSYNKKFNNYLENSSEKITF
jgi:O-antigen ligase